MTPQEEFDAIVAQLEAATPDRPAPQRIEKPGRFLIAGNTDALRMVAADKHGRLWREDRDALVLVYDPIWHVER